MRENIIAEDTMTQRTVHRLAQTVAIVAFDTQLGSLHIIVPGLENERNLIERSLGKLSALCGCVVASTGSSCGITYLMGGDYTRICNSVKNMIANLTGMICDGAKPSCALKISSGVSTALLSALLSMEGKCVTSAEGIVDDDVDKCIHNLTSIGADAMRATDDMVLDIMTHK
jgi:L-cysteine desulfidase